MELRPWDSVNHIITDCFGNHDALTLSHRTIVMSPEIESLAAIPAVQRLVPQKPVLSLEKSFSAENLKPLDLHKKNQMGNYLQPNEGGVSAIKPHLDSAFRAAKEPSYLVAVGTERTLFDLVLAENCKGLIIRDIDPRVIAYMHFNIMLLRICENRNEYIELTSSPKNYNKIKAKLMADRNIPLDVYRSKLKNWFLGGFKAPEID